MRSGYRPLERVHSTVRFIYLDAPFHKLDLLLGKWLNVNASL